MIEELELENTISRKIWKIIKTNFFLKCVIHINEYYYLYSFNRV